MSADSILRSCPLCGGWANLIYQKHWGFQAPACFDIFECDQCDASFADPLESSSQLYELIYRNADSVSGYERYGRYRRLLQHASCPMQVLASQEDVYWAIFNTVEKFSQQQGGSLKILEIGSGFGYLTFCLRSAGHDCSGLDISAAAVEEARRAFGNFYQVGDLKDYAQCTAERYDMVVATELIEHVRDPMGIVAQARSLLKPGGAVLLTTPNKDLYPRKYVWNTDPPPVHLWWFSKTSFRFMAWKLGMSVAFFDFRGYFGRESEIVRAPSKPQTFDASGQVVFKDSFAKSIARRAVRALPVLFKPLAKLLLRTLAAERYSEQRYRESLSLCVLLRSPCGTESEGLNGQRS